MANLECDDSVRACEPSWVRRLSTGAALMYCGYVLFVACFVGSLVLFAYGGSEQLLLKSSKVWWYGTAAVFLVGVWLLTTADPRNLSDDRDMWVRAACRLGWVILLALEAILRLAPERPPMPELVLTLVNSSVTLVWLSLLLIYLAHLSARLSITGIRTLSYACLALLALKFTAGSVREVTQWRAQQPVVASPTSLPAQQSTSAPTAGRATTGPGGSTSRPASPATSGAWMLYSLVTTPLMAIMLFVLFRRSRGALRRVALEAEQSSAAPPSDLAV